jgi:transcription antitermination factor NusG
MSSVWVAIELTSWGEKEPTHSLHKELKHYWGEGIEVFIPFHIDGGGMELGLVKGYAFVKLPDDFKLTKLLRYENSKYIRKIITEMLNTKSGKERRISPIDNSYIDDLKSKLNKMMMNKFKEGEIVKVRGGLYSGLQGKIIESDAITASVYIELKSLNIIANVPIKNLAKI